jgi:hypothetical protein
MLAAHHCRSALAAQHLIGQSGAMALSDFERK